MPKGIYKRTKEQYLKQKEGWAKKRAEGYVSPLKGRKHSSLSEEHKNKISKTLKGRSKSDGYKRKMSEVWAKKIELGYVGPHKGKKVSEDSIKACQETWVKKRAEGYVSPLKGRPGSWTGKKHSEETKKQQSITMKQKYANGYVSPLKGRPNYEKRGSNSSNWNPNRHEVARNATVRHIMVYYLKLPLNANLDAHEVISCLDYTKEEFFINIEEKFYFNMEWQGRGNRIYHWNMHHKIPVSWFVSCSIESPKILNALDNLQPLWHKDHIEEHKRLRKFSKAERKFWVDLFVYHIEHKRRAPIDLQPYKSQQREPLNMEYRQLQSSYNARQSLSP